MTPTISPGSAALPRRLAGVTPAQRLLAAGSVLFRQGDPSFGIFELISGRLRLIRVTPGGTPVTLHTVRPGELFAEASIFSPHYHCDAVAILHCEIRVYPKAELIRHFRHDGEDLWAFAAELARRVQDLRSRIELRQIRSAPERVLQSLRLHGGERGFGKTDGTLKQFAEEIGLTHEALYRALAKLEQQGRIARNDDSIRSIAG